MVPARRSPAAEQAESPSAPTTQRAQAAAPCRKQRGAPLVPGGSRASGAPPPVAKHLPSPPRIQATPPRPSASEAATGAEPVKARLSVGEVELTHQSISVRHLDRLVGGLLLATSPRVAWATLVRRTYGVTTSPVPDAAGASVFSPRSPSRRPRGRSWSTSDGHLCQFVPERATLPTRSSDASAPRAPRSRRPRTGTEVGDVVGEGDARPRCGRGGGERAATRRDAFANNDPPKTQRSNRQGAKAPRNSGAWRLGALAVHLSLGTWRPVACKGAMNRAAASSGAEIHYLWENRSWTAGKK